MDDAPPPPQNPLLRHHNHTAAYSSSSSCTTSSSITAKSSSPSSSSSQSDFELISIKPIAYISLKDILPYTAVNSPRPMVHYTAQSPGSEICIRNRLVKQAAWAYLQPMSTLPDSAGNGFLHRIFGGHNPFAALLRALTRAFDWLLRAVRVGCSSR